MKIRYPIIATIVLIIIEMLTGTLLPYSRLGNVISGIIFLLILVCLGLIACLIIRNIFRAIRGAATGGRSRDYAAEARRACEAVTPKKDKNAAPPWEE